MNTWTLKFSTPELENGYRTNRMSYSDVPLLGRLILWVIILVSIARRFQLLFDSYYGSHKYDAAYELRLTLEYMAILVLESLFYLVARLDYLKGSAFIIGGFLSIIDASCLYSPIVVRLTPVYSYISEPEIERTFFSAAAALSSSSMLEAGLFLPSASL